MNRIALVFAASLAAATLSAAPASEKRTVAQTLDESFAQAEKEFVPAVEALPEAQWAFVPTAGEFKGVRTFGAQAKHVAAVNYFIGSFILGEKPPVEVGKGDGPETMTGRAEVLAYLKASYVYAHKAVASLNAKTMLTPMKAPFGPGKTSRLAMANLLLAHTMDHYGQIVVSLRMNGIVPPASRQ